ncbi:hypothetical protein M569_17387, partial [Genlisea aurea]
MGANQSNEPLDSSDSESDSVSRDADHCGSESEGSYGTPVFHASDHNQKEPTTPSSLEEVGSRLKELKLKYGNKSAASIPKNAVKLYLFAAGSTGKSKWTISEKLVCYEFVKKGSDEDEEDDAANSAASLWILKIGSQVRATIDENLQVKAHKDQRRVDFLANGVWAIKFFTSEEYDTFVKKYEACSFENTYGYDASDENKLKVYGKDFLGWAKPESADDSMWEGAEDSLTGTPPSTKTPMKEGVHSFTEEFEEPPAKGGAIQSLALGAMDNSFLVSDSGIQVVRNYSHGVQGKGLYVHFDEGKLSTAAANYSTPRKALLMRAETNMLLMSPSDGGKSHSRGLHQLDIETGRVVSQWRFEKDGTDITMRDITNDSKGAQLDPSGSTFLGLDDNRLCRWDMRDRNGIVQNVVNERNPVLNWAAGHQFSRGTNFQCFATAGDGSVVVGSLDGKIRLYSTSSMRQAKTAFPGLGSPITHVDVTYDGKWVLGTTDSYLVVICTLFADKNGNVKTGFAGRMGNRISAPRLLKLTPLDSHMAGTSKFRNAHFSWVTENGKQERHLVATVGKFSVIWNFQQVKDGSHECYRNQVGLKSCYCYKTVLKDDSIVDSRFMHDKFALVDSPEAPLVVATHLKVSSFSISGS